MKTKLFKKLLSAAISAIITTQFVVSVFPFGASGAYLNTEYLLYSDKAVTVNMNTAVFNGNVFTGDSFDYLGNSTCYVHEILNAEKTSGNLKTGSTTEADSPKPDYRSLIESKLSGVSASEGNIVLEEDDHDLSKPLSVNGDLWINRTSFSGMGYIRAEGNIQYDAVRNDKDCELVLFSSDGNITVEGSDVTLGGVIYAPNGKVEINAKNLCIRGMVIAKSVELNGTNLTFDRISENGALLIQSGSSLTIKGLDKTFKQNRKVTLDISESFGTEKLDRNSVSWSFSNAENVKIDEESSDELTKNFIVTEPGTYRVAVTANAEDGSKLECSGVLRVTADEAPVAAFGKKIGEKDENGRTPITLEDASYSPDGDTIASRTWSVFFDSNNDGDFSDEEETVFSTGNEKTVTYTAAEIGNYRFRLVVTEDITDTIPSLLPENANRSAEIHDNGTLEDTPAVPNDPPEVEIVVSNEDASVDEQIAISVSAKDDDGIAYVKVTADGTVISEKEGTVIYECKTEGELIIAVEAADSTGKVTIEKKVISVTDRRDRIAPVITVDADKNVTFEDGKLTIIGSVTDDVQLENYKVSYAPEGSDDFREAFEAGSEVNSGVIASFAVPEGYGRYTVMISAEDTSHNTSYITFTAELAAPATEPPTTEEETTTTTTTTTKETTTTTTTTTAHVDTPADITLTASKYTAEIGETVKVNAAASDVDGLKEFKVYIDGELVSETQGEFTFTRNEPETAAIKVTTLDSFGGTSTKSIEVVFEDNSDKSAPTAAITSPEEEQTVGGKVSIVGSAFDETELREYTLEYKKSDSEAFTLISSSHNDIRDGELGIWDTASLENADYVIRLTAVDAGGNSAEASVTCTVFNTEGPGSGDDEKDERLSSIVDEMILYEETAVYKAVASDDIDLSTLSLTFNGSEVTLDSNLEYTFKADKLFDNEFVLTAKTTSGETLTVKDNVLVYETGKPTVNVELNKSENIHEHDDIIVTITAEDISGIRKTQILYDGVEIMLNENNQLLLYDFDARPHSVIIRAWDNFNNCRAYLLSFYIVEDEVTVDGGDASSDENTDGSGSSGGNAGGSETDTLTAKIYNPISEDVLSSPTYIFGRVGGTAFRNYKLEYKAAGSPEYVTLGEGTKPLTNQALGEFDPTMLRNGLYELKLTAWDENNNSKSDSITVSAEGDMKIGNYSIEFEDMELNVGGIPVTMLRGYDSRDRAKSGDFGFGWNMTTCSVTVTKSCELNKHWIKKSQRWETSYSPEKPHIVSINWGNGTVEKFSMSLESGGFSSLSPVTIKYNSMNGSKSTLSSLDDDDDWLYGSDTIYNFDFDEYDPVYWKLKRPDGTEYLISTEKGLIWYVNNYGDKFRIYSNAIAVNDDKTRAIFTERDSKERITKITSPSGNTVEYTYDENGDLASVKDITGNVVTFKYRDHFLEEIIDPRGVRVSRNEYDDDGRLIKSIDADGNEIIYSHDVEAREEAITDRNGGVTRYTYDHNGNVLSLTDPLGNTIRNTYDKNGNPATKTDALGNVTKYTYDDDGNLLEMTDAEGNTIKNTFNSNGALTSINTAGADIFKVIYDDKGNVLTSTDALGNETSFTYTEDGLLSSITDDIGTYANMTYDRQGRITSMTTPLGTVTDFTYDESGNCISKTTTYNKDGETKSLTEYYSYDEGGNLIKTIDSDGNIVTNEYNSIGKIACTTDPNGRQTFFSYDDRGNLSKVKYADGTSESFTYDREGNPITATDRLGRTVEMTYDKVGNLLSKNYPNGTKQEYVYDESYHLISSTSVTGAETKYEYDAIGRNTAIIDALGNRTEYEYSELSQISLVRDAKGNECRYEYDLNGSRTKVVFADGSSTSAEYNIRGQITKTKDQYGNATEYTYDEADRLIGITDAFGNTTAYAYDDLGNLVCVTDANGNKTKYDYDDHGRVIKTTNALGKTAEVTYDESGNVLATTDYAGKLTSFTYDSLGRIESKTNKDGTIAYSYTADGKLSSVKSPSGVTSFTYDSMDGLIKISYPDGNCVEYTYDVYGRLTGINTAFGNIGYDYDKLDRLIRVVDKNGMATVYEYDANGNRSAVKYANGITVTYVYDELNRLISEKALDKQGGIVAQYEYTLGALGERTKITEIDRTIDYTYDVLCRLTSEKITESNGTVTEYTYAYDKMSNRVLKTENGKKTSYTYNELNQLVKEDDKEYSYDDAGNLVSVKSPSKTVSYTYNEDNKLIRSAITDGDKQLVETYEYDFAGNRTAKKTGSDCIYYLNDINNDLTQVLAELDDEGNLICFYTRGIELISQERGGNTLYFLEDGHGSVRQLADNTGSITDTYTFDAWGNLLDSTGNSENTYLYCGEQLDSATGLYYLRARYMDPSTGTFTTMDNYPGSVFDPTSLHKYLYAHADPVMNYDPTGNLTIFGFNVSQAISSIIDKASAINAEFALNYFKKFMASLAKRALVGLIGGVLATVDQILGGVTDKEELAEAFIGGFLTGFAFTFIKGKIAMALSGLAVLVGLGGTVESFINGKFWQGVYRLALSIAGAVGWCFKYGDCFNKLTPLTPADESLARQYEIKALMEQGFSESKAIELIDQFNNGENPGFKFRFHFTSFEGAEGITSDRAINPSSSGVGGKGVYTGTTPTPSWALKHIPYIGWGLGKAPVRIPIFITPDMTLKEPSLPILHFIHLPPQCTIIEEVVNLIFSVVS